MNTPSRRLVRLAARYAKILDQVVALDRRVDELLDAGDNTGQLEDALRKLRAEFDQVDRQLMTTMDREGVPLLSAGGRVYVSTGQSIGAKLDSETCPVYVHSVAAADL